jgi:hypothetical protein
VRRRLASAGHHHQVAGVGSVGVSQVRWLNQRNDENKGWRSHGRPRVRSPPPDDLARTLLQGKGPVVFHLRSFWGSESGFWGARVARSPRSPESQLEQGDTFFFDLLANAQII